MFLGLAELRTLDVLRSNVLNVRRGSLRADILRILDMREHQFERLTPSSVALMNRKGEI